LEIGIGLPATVPGIGREALLDWSRRAEERDFSSLGVIDRLVYPNYEPLVAIAAAAAVTETIRFSTDILIVPYRVNALLLAKQAATVDSLSNGRLTLGVGIGSRPDDYEASGVPISERGARMDRMLAEMKACWSGAKRGYAGPVGPPPVREGGPELLVGGRVDASFRRAAEHGDGWTMGGGSPDHARAGREKTLAAWEKAGRDGTPRIVALAYAVLGDDADAQARATIGDYYAFAPEYAEMAVAGVAKGEEEVEERVRGFEQAGCDELIMFPSSSDPGQVDKLAATVL
jgi:alkanesulfonate monooxygenase SsuD/methylene tetrahydromethanopterin reductase-like flavin-dependent oxidoreductase (luciferase family)